MHEVKFDGYRLIARIENAHARLTTRKGLDWTPKFAPVQKALEALPVAAALLDGEVVVETKKGAPNFGALQQDLSEGRSDRFRFYVFDIMHLDGVDLAQQPLMERKAVLVDLLAGHQSDVLKLSEHFEGRGDTVLEHVCRLTWKASFRSSKPHPIALAARRPG